jgi:hypothetical protein
MTMGYRLGDVAAHGAAISARAVGVGRDKPSTDSSVGFSWV